MMPEPRRLAFRPLCWLCADLSPRENVTAGLTRERTLSGLLLDVRRLRSKKTFLDAFELVCVR